MKKYLLILSATLVAGSVYPQNNKQYPDPEFSNEVYLYRKDSATKLLRLEKESSKIETKTKLGGFGGAESGYILDGEKSAVRLSSGTNLSFVYSTGSKDAKPSGESDSMLRANGIDPSLMKSYGDMMDPANMITLYKTDVEKGQRKILMVKSGGAMPFASKKIKASAKYAFSVKKIREGYWELIIDKSLSKGEYAFTVMGVGVNSTDGGAVLFAFAIE